MKQQLHRSYTFWAGLLVMAFVVWAWRDSMRNLSDAHYGRVSISHHAGGVVIRYHDEYGGGVEGITREPYRGLVIDAVYGVDFIEESSPTGPPPPCPPLMAGRGEGTLDVFIPHWLMLLAIAIPWLVLLLWRARRRHRHQARDSEATT